MLKKLKARLIKKTKAIVTPTEAVKGIFSAKNKVTSKVTKALIRNIYEYFVIGK